MLHDILQITAIFLSGNNACRHGSQHLQVAACSSVNYLSNTQILLDQLLRCHRTLFNVIKYGWYRNPESPLVSCGNKSPNFLRLRQNMQIRRYFHFQTASDIGTQVPSPNTQGVSRL
jgi:hypothetical protein